MRIESRILAPVLPLTLALFACSRAPETGPGRIHWDRDVCARCAMAVSDHRFAAQVRGAPAGQRTQVHPFDDFGCAVLWLEQQPWKDDPRTEIWVADHRDGHWLDARKAWYLPDQTTPMDYGLGAQEEQTEKALSFEQAVEHIHKLQKKR